MPPTTRTILPPLVTALVIAFCPATRGDDGTAYLTFIRRSADALRSGDKAPADAADWAARRRAIRAGLLDAWGGFPADPCPLDARVLGTLKRDGYRVEKVVFQTRPGVRMTANAYVPDAPGRRAAILMVHGHWGGAKQDPHVQPRCIGAAKLGFFVLAVDAFGAGERGVGKALGEYHGGLTGATLLPVGLPLSGLQVYENMRAVDYLLTRPEVDPGKIGITGASGGGNQSMYAGAWDERLKAVVPVCSVGNYRSYLGAACCLCEVVPGALRFTEEWGVLGMTAPRGLMVINATKDAVQFSVAESDKSLALAEPVYRLFDKPGNVRHTVFESGHDYSRPMREAMYGWMTHHLKGEGDGSPIPEPALTTDDPEALRCYPGDTRPDDFVTLPRFAAAEGRKLVAAKTVGKDADLWRAEAEKRRQALVGKVFGGFPNVPPVAPAFKKRGTGRGVTVGALTFESEPGLPLSAVTNFRDDKTAPLVVTIDLGDIFNDDFQITSDSLLRASRSISFCELRTEMDEEFPGKSAGPAPGHNTAEWGLWLGRPMLGQWVFDVRRLLDSIETLQGSLPGEVVLIGKGRGGLVALCAAAVDKRVTRVAAIGTLASYITDKPYVGQNLGLMAPGILREVGDIPQIAALVAPRRVVIAGAVGGDGKALTAVEVGSAFGEATRAWNLLGAGDALSLTETRDIAETVKAVTR